jgi:hypothetical protein
MARVVDHSSLCDALTQAIAPSDGANVSRPPVAG